MRGAQPACATNFFSGRAGKKTAAPKINIHFVPARRPQKGTAQNGEAGEYARGRKRMKHSLPGRNFSRHSARPKSLNAQPRKPKRATGVSKRPGAPHSHRETPKYPPPQAFGAGTSTKYCSFRKRIKNKRIRRRGNAHAKRGLLKNFKKRRLPHLGGARKSERFKRRVRTPCRTACPALRRRNTCPRRCLKSPGD